MDDVEVETRGRREEQPPGAEPVARWPRVPAQVSQRMRPSRRTLTGLAAAVVAVLAVAGILLSKLGDPVGLARGLLNIPTPVPAATATPIPLNQTWFYLENAIPWGVLTVDGRKITQFYSSSPLVVVLPRGRHTLAYDAAPFPELRCVASVPADAHDTCPLDAPFVKTQARFPEDLQRRALDLGADIAHLPADQRAALAAAVQQQLALDPTPATVAPGERYRAADVTFATATQPLRATLVSQPWGDASGFPGNCPFLCAEAVDPSQTPDAWPIAAHVREGFRYTTLDGQVVADLAPFGEPRQSSGDPREYLIQFQVRWDGAWHVTENPQAVGTHLDPCLLARGLGPYGGFSGSSPDLPFTFDRTYAAPHPADGCVVVLVPSPSNPNPPDGPIYYLYRFGVLLAATPAALAVAAVASTGSDGPPMQMASPDEQALALRIVAANQVATSSH